MPNILNFQKVSHKFKQGKSIINVLNSVNFILKSNCIVALVGSSGSGKSTFLHLAGLLESPNKGKIYINNKIVSKLDNSARTKLRRNSLGFVYQKIYLLPEFTALENVMIPQLIIGIDKMRAINEAKNILSSMGLKNRLNHRPSALSGGEQQRVAIARAIINKPSLILADEPTGNLDSASSNLISKILLQSIRETQASAIIATHSLELAKKCDLIYKIDSGEIF
ncbi:MAG: ABC transporter [Alphaproteobacteria bacterium]|nr:ABC transporter [Alphaproteobacteria bacterium]|tara:strand:+ start:584 stop:1255 length:672 start_codon:yes stop_codon:yes gene_type:complete